MARDCRTLPRACHERTCSANAKRHANSRLGSVGVAADESRESAAASTERRGCCCCLVELLPLCARAASAHSQRATSMPVAPTLCFPPTPWATAGCSNPNVVWLCMAAERLGGALAGSRPASAAAAAAREAAALEPLGPTPPGGPMRGASREEEVRVGRGGMRSVPEGCGGR